MSPDYIKAIDSLLNVTGILAYELENLVDSIEYESAEVKEEMDRLKKISTKAIDLIILFQKLERGVTH